jgi:glutamyl-tRNA synthetase
MTNFLALLGWSLDDRTELLSRQELIKHFSLERVGKTAAIFNKEKLEWMNGVYLRQLSLEEFAHRAMPFLERDLPESVERPLNKGYVSRILSLVQERAKTLAEVPQLASFFFVDDLQYDTAHLLAGRLDAEVATQALTVALRSLEDVTSWDSAALEAALRPLATELNLSTRELFGLLRVAVTGRTAAPPLFQTMAVLGKEKSLHRLDKALRLLSGLS